MALTEQQYFREGFIRGYMAGDQTISGNIPTVIEVAGPPGDPGPQGPHNTVTGLPGDPGLTGLTGPIGFDGDRGATGASGIDNFVTGLPGIGGLKGLVGDSPKGPTGDPGVDGIDGSLQKVMTDIQFYADGYVATYSDLSIRNYSATKDVDNRITLLTNVTAIPNEVTTIGYNVGNML